MCNILKDFVKNLVEVHLFLMFIKNEVCVRGVKISLCLCVAMHCLPSC